MLRNTEALAVLLALLAMAGVCEGAPPPGCECLDATKVQVGNM